jgi:hypothetical protein
MTTMAKHVTKGYYFDTMDQRYNDPALRPQILAQLRDPHTAIADIGTLDNKPLDVHERKLATNSARIRTKRKNHLNYHWFGHPHPLTSDEDYPPGNNPSFFTNSTGWWNNWQGQPEQTMRCALIRALEVSMGLHHWCPEHGSTGTVAVNSPFHPDSAIYQLPIDFFWICGVTRFEAHIYRSQVQVTVLFITPGFAYEIEDFSADPSFLLDQHVRPLQSNSSWFSKLVSTIFSTGKPKPTKISVFVGQDYDEPSSGSAAVMKPGVITHHLDKEDGGVSATFP